METIVAQCTPVGPGALAIIRVSGPDAVSAVERIAHIRGKKFSERESHSIIYGEIHEPESNRLIDQVLFLLMRAPRTFTGEDTIEITTHNNQIIIERVIDLLCTNNQNIQVRRARPGEFSEQAFINNKIDLVQAEAIHDIITAPSQEALARSLGQLSGSLSSYLDNIEKELIEITSLIEASFEFLDEEQRDLDFENLIKQKVLGIKDKLSELLRSQSHNQKIREGIRVGIVGPVNAGKSTLLNSLLGKNRALVSNQAGTTRDTVEAGLSYDGMTWTFVDTAGLRETDNHIEQAGIIKSLEEAEQSDILLAVFDSSRDLTHEEQSVMRDIIEKHAGKIIISLNKSDLELSGSLDTLIAGISQNFPNIKIIKTSGVKDISENNISLLRKSIEDMRSELLAQGVSPFLLSHRQLNIVSDLSEKIEVIAELYPDKIDYELMAHHMREALRLLATATGHGAQENIIDKVFRSFCVGK